SAVAWIAVSQKTLYWLICLLASRADVSQRRSRWRIADGKTLHQKRTILPGHRLIRRTWCVICNQRFERQVREFPGGDNDQLLGRTQRALQWLQQVAVELPALRVEPPDGLPYGQARGLFHEHLPAEGNLAFYLLARR